MRSRVGSETRKVYGQNFLRAGTTVGRLVSDAGIDSDDLVVEIGGGSGTLTRALEASGCRVLVVERDPRYSRELAARYAGHPRVTVVEGDVRTLRWPTDPVRVFANIPFGLTTEILHVVLEAAGPAIYRADLIVQYDVARKRARPPQGNKLNLRWAPWWTMRVGRRLSAELFVPRPSVDAAMLIVKRRAEPLVAWEEASLWRGILDETFKRGGEPIRAALRGILTATQFRRLSAHSGLQPTTPVSQLTLSDWLAVHGVVRDHVSPERWPRASARSGESRARASQRRGR